jgi:hypothetical protein
VILNHRDEFPQLIDSLGLTTAAEIGVATGLFSRVLLRSKITRLWMVDYWMVDNPGDIAQGFRPEAEAVAATSEGRAIIVDKKSIEAAKDFADESIDFVYIDSQHIDPNAHEDVVAWWPKARVILAGHDYTPCNMEYRVPYGVMQAAEDLAAREGLDLYVTGASASVWTERLRAALASLALSDLGPFGANVPSWWVIKV